MFKPPFALSCLAACIFSAMACAIELPTTADAIRSLQEEIKKNPTSANHEQLANLYAQTQDYVNAASHYSKSAELGNAKAYRAAGANLFFTGKIDASIAAFDAYAKNFPDEAPQLWERGIALYYAKRYADGRKQFESHKTVNPHDVENAAWHFICAAKELGVEKARKELIFIDTEKDTRVPMKQVYLLFKGDGKPEDVLAAAENAPRNSAQYNGQMCYAHLYLGLYFEGTGDAKKAHEHIEKAAVEFKQDHYMGLVARLHWVLMK